MLPRPAKAPLKAKCSDKMNDESNLIKKTPKRRFFFFYLCVLLNILFRMRSLAAPSQGSQTSVNNLPCAKKKKKENPHTHTQHSQKKGGFELHRMAEHLGPSSSVWNPRAEEQIKCGTAGEEQEGKFQTNICTCGGSRVGGGLPNVFMSWTPKMNTPDFCSPVPTFFFKSAQAHVRAFYSSSSSSYNYYYWCNFLNDTLHVKYIHHFLNTNKL